MLFRRAVFVAVAAVGFYSAEAMAQSVVDDEFDSGELSWKYWCPCQIDTVDAPVTFPFDPSESGTRFARVEVNDFALGGNRCLSSKPYLECTPPQFSAATMLLAVPAEPAPAADTPDSLGSSFFGVPPQPSGPALLTAPQAAMGPRPEVNPYCTDDVELRAHRHHEDDECIQRQELRLRKFKPPSGDAYWYSFRFRMPKAEEIKDRENSIRWVIAQWKEEPLSKDYTDMYGPDWGPSPFLALRFDDGVLHVTVQSDECRCLVASAPHPTKVIDGWTEDGHGGSIPTWENGPAKLCESSKAGDPPHKKCDADLNLEFGSDPILSSALGSWVELRFRVQAGMSPSGAKIEVMEGDRPIVTVTGAIGYKFAEPDPSVAEHEQTVTKFKIGHYRDYMPFPSTMEIDWFKVTKAN